MAVRIPKSPGFYVSDSAYRAASSLKSLDIYLLDFDGKWTLAGVKVSQEKLPADLWRLRLEQR